MNTIALYIGYIVIGLIAVVLILVCAGFVLYNLGEYMRGYNEGKNDIIELMYSTMKDNEAKNE